MLSRDSSGVSTSAAPFDKAEPGQDLPTIVSAAVDTPSYGLLPALDDLDSLESDIAVVVPGFQLAPGEALRLLDAAIPNNTQAVPENRPASLEPCVIDVPRVKEDPLVDVAAVPSAAARRAFTTQKCDRLLLTSSAIVVDAVEQAHVLCQQILTARNKENIDDRLPSDAFLEFFKATYGFIQATEALCGRSCAQLRGTLLTQVCFGVFRVGIGGGLESVMACSFYVYILRGYLTPVHRPLFSSH